MDVITTTTNRLGNRPCNQDRCLVVNRSQQSLLVIADGMGGHPRGELAAQVTVDTLRKLFEQQRGRIDDPVSFLRTAIHSAHLNILRRGEQEQPPVDPRTVCVACLVQGNQAWWAHVGDSRLYLLRRGKIVARTVDHTPLQELLSRGEISEETAHNHPLRNNVNRCLGGNAVLPKISFSSHALQTGDTLLLCSDGLWSAVDQHQLITLNSTRNLETAAGELAEAAERSTYPHSDNISLVALRWLKGNSAPQTKPAQPRCTTGQTDKLSGKDPLQNAIDDIHRAMLDYASEIKKA